MCISIAARCATICVTGLFLSAGTPVYVLYHTNRLYELLLTEERSSSVCRKQAHRKHFLLHPDNRPLSKKAHHTKPRRVLSPRHVSGYTLFVAWVGVCAGLFAAHVDSNVREWWRFNQVNVATTATVLEHWEEERYSRVLPLDANAPAIIFAMNIIIRLPMATRAATKAAANVNHGSYLRAAPGTRISVIYDPADPTRSRLNTSVPRCWRNSAAACSCALLCWYPLALLLSGIATVRRRRRLHGPGAQILPGQVYWSMGALVGQAAVPFVIKSRLLAFRRGSPGALALGGSAPLSASAHCQPALLCYNSIYGRLSQQINDPYT
jgi:hypothetical protein